MNRRHSPVKSNLTLKDVRRYFDGKYHTIEQVGNRIKDSRRKKPIVKRLYKNHFVIISPFVAFQKRIAFIFYPVVQERESHWVLNSMLTGKFRYHYLQILKEQCSKQTFQKWLSYLKYLLIYYQIGTRKDGTYFIRISDYSIQNAYYRLISFELAYYHLIQFILLK